ncbi:MAG TPA: helix-turn-helix transcriptional regulator [Candidatus Micrarchaeaceae archaeon]|nr:helix-turn-helix transcriptional regulator [Candidatus Micrarchaeaceae archaeon]
MSRRPISGGELHITPRQRQILDLAVRGCTDKEIAADMGIAVSTVRTYLERFYRENQLRNKAEAVAAWQHYIDAERQKTGRSAR